MMPILFGIGEFEAFHLGVHRDGVAAEPIVGIGDQATEIDDNGQGRINDPPWRRVHRHRPVLEHLHHTAAPAGASCPER